MTAPSAPSAPSPGRHVRGLDALRFVMALWVVFGHVGFVPLPVGLGRGVVRGLYHGFENGAAAVVVFFVISGFCIHYPFRAARSIDLLHFYARRHIRILLPIAAAAVIASPLGISMSLLDYSILWSLVCEEIYYTIYPLLLWARARIGWPTLIAGAFVTAFAVVAWRYSTIGQFGVYGWRFNWLVGLPCWLLGAHLAESIDLGRAASDAPSRARLWAWRAGAFALGAVGSTQLWFHAPVRVPYAISLDLFAIYAFFWLRAEILRAEAVGVSPLEGLGVFSYSMYLVHLQASTLFSRLVPGAPFGAIPTWTVRIAWIIAFSWLFFRAVERPAHTLARRAQQRVLAWRAGVSPTGPEPATPDHG